MPPGVALAPRRLRRTAANLARPLVSGARATEDHAVSETQDWRARRWAETHQRIYDTAMRLFQEQRLRAGERRADRRGRRGLGADVLRALPVQGTPGDAAADGRGDRTRCSPPSRPSCRWRERIRRARARCGSPPGPRSTARRSWPAGRSSPRRRRCAPGRRSSSAPTAGMVADALPGEPGATLTAGRAGRGQRLPRRVHRGHAGLGRRQRRAQARGDSSTRRSTPCSTLLSSGRQPRRAAARPR